LITTQGLVTSVIRDYLLLFDNPAPEGIRHKWAAVSVFSRWPILSVWPVHMCTCFGHCMYLWN